MFRRTVQTLIPAIALVAPIALAAPAATAGPAPVADGSVPARSAPAQPSHRALTQVPDTTSQKTCEWVDAVAAWYPKWASSQFCATFWGSSESTKMGYAWKIAPGTNTNICVKGLGYPKQPDGSRKATWYSLGCGKSGGGSNIPWGPIIAYPKVKAQTQPGMLGGLYTWTD